MKKFLGKLLGGVKKGAKVALPVAAALVDPRLTPLAVEIVSAINTAEKIPGAKGAEKALFAQQIVGRSLPQAIATYEQVFETEIVDETLLAEALKLQQEAYVKTMKAFGKL